MVLDPAQHWEIVLVDMEDVHYLLEQQLNVLLAGPTRSLARRADSQRYVLFYASRVWSLRSANKHAQKEKTYHAAAGESGIERCRKVHYQPTAYLVLLSS